MTAEERYKDFLNVVAKVGISGNVHDEYAKTLSIVNGLDSYNAIQAQNISQPAPTPAPPEGMMGGQITNTQPMEGQGELNLP